MSTEPQNRPPDSDPLLRPIPGRRLGGVDLRYSGVYESIREARRSDDPRLPQGVWQRDVKKSDFKEVERLCQEALTQKGKDLQVMAWLIEAWYELYGLQGLKSGLVHMRGLLEIYWTHSFPSLLKNDPTARLSPFMWLNEKFSLSLNSIPITKQSVNDLLEEFTFGDWKILSTVSRAQDSEDNKDDRARDLLAAVERTPWLFYQGLSEEVAHCKDLIVAVEALITKRLKGVAPPLARMRRQLTDLEESIQKIGAQRGEVRAKISLEGEGRGEEAMKPEEKTQMSPSKKEERHPIKSLEKSDIQTGETGNFPSHREAIHSRAQAYGLLQEVERYFAKTEPQNPALCLLKRILAWKDASLENIIGEVLKEQGDINSLKTALGISSGAESDE